MEYVAGVDGGGTKTRVLCLDGDGNEIGRRTFDATNINSVGRERLEAVLAEITDHLASLGTCRALCLGLAGTSNVELSGVVETALRKAGVQKWKLVGDHVIALHGALNGAPGIALIAGTGSICFGRGAAGEEVRAGGWGHLIGDEGSAYGLGRDALGAVARAMDGCGEPTALCGLLSSRFGLSDRSGIISYVYGKDKSAVAALAPCVEEAAAGNDAAAQRILRQNAESMCDIVRAVASRLRLECTRVAMLGGLLENDTRLRAEFLRVMHERQPEIECIPPCHDACYGAAMIAQDMEGTYASY